MASFASSITDMPGAKSPLDDASADVVDQSLVDCSCRWSRHWSRSRCCCILSKLPADGCRAEKCRQLRSVTEKAEHSVIMLAAEIRNLLIFEIWKDWMFEIGWKFKGANCQYRPRSSCANLEDGWLADCFRWLIGFNVKWKGVCDESDSTVGKVELLSRDSNSM